MDAILKNVKIVSRESRTRLVQFKILQRIYWLHRVGLSDSPTCWKCRQDSGTLVHVLWECPEIQKFWSSIHKVIQEIVDQSIPFWGRLYILGDPSTISHLPSPLAQWTQTTTMLGRKLLVKDWKGPSVPSFGLWHSSLAQLAALEKLYYRLLNRENDFLKQMVLLLNIHKFSDAFSSVKVKTKNLVVWLLSGWGASKLYAFKKKKLQYNTNYTI